jgi:phenylacetate-CoA ligase
MVFLKNKLKKFYYTKVISALKKSVSTTLIEQSEEKALAAFAQARNYVPFYKVFLQKAGFQNIPVTNIESFSRQVPFLDKNTVYNDQLPPLIFEDLNSEECSNILLSSGSSGHFSFGIHSKERLVKDAQFINILFDLYFNILDKKTLIINCLTSAVHLPPLDATIIEIGPKADALHYVIKNLSPQFDQTVIIGDNYFIKNALEDGLASGIDYAALNIHLILGGIYLPESLRKHLAAVLQKDKSNFHKNLIISSMGISEFGVNLFFESLETIRLRQWVEQHPEWRTKVLGTDDPGYLPMFFNYFPQIVYLETVNRDLVITNLDMKSSLPLIRYNTKDKGHVIPFADLQKWSNEEPQMKTMLPPFKSPLVLIYGKEECVRFGDKNIYPHRIQQGLYEDFDSALKTTGYFRLRTEDGHLKLDIQLKKDSLPSNKLLEQFRRSALKYISIETSVMLYPYHEFPYGMELDYERKFSFC